MLTNAHAVLKEWDVITHIADTLIDDRDVAKLGADLWVDFRYCIQKVANTGKVSLTIVRGGKSSVVQLSVSPNRPC